MKILVSALVGVLVIGAIVYFKIDWESRAIYKAFDQLVETVEKEGPVSPFEALGRSRELKSKFTERLLVEYLPGRALPRDREALGVAFLSIWNKVESISIRVVRHDVDVDDNGYEAESRLVARCSVIYDGSERMGDTLEYVVFWTQVDGDWLIERLIATGP